MKRLLSLLTLWVLALPAAPAARAAEEAMLGAQAPVVLPPFIVGRGTHLGWLYQRVGERMEFLSRCSPQVTAQFAAAQARAHHSLRRLLPERFLHQTELPTAFILVPLQEKPRDGDAARDLYATDAAAVAAELRRTDSRASAQFRFLPNMRLEDGYTTAVLTFIDTQKFDFRSLIVAPDYVRALLSRSTPALPGWFIEGVLRIYERSDLQPDAGLIRVGSLLWTDEESTLAWQRHPTASRALLTATELFTEPPSRLDARKHALWQAQAGLFIAWALAAEAGTHREALWQLVERTRTQPVNEEIFEACFGFGYSELRDRLSDFLPRAVGRFMWVESLPPGPEPSPLGVPQQATAQQATRLLGEWERLQIPHVKARYPQLAALYAERARKTLRTAALSDAAAAELLALCEVEQGDHAAAGELFGFARELGASGARLHYEQARSIWLRTLATQPESAPVAAAPAQLCRELLLPALRTAAPTPEALQLLSDIYLRSKLELASEDAVLFTAAAQRFLRLPALCFRVALVYTRERRFADASELLTASLPFATEPRLTAMMQNLRAQVQAQR